jgi:methyl-accepting chemotaxis protein/methyl-accepting chemotaxis protein-1 (serine sensor receptor)
LGDALRLATGDSGRRVQLAARLQTGFQEMRAHAESGQIALVIQLLIKKHQESLDSFHARRQSAEGAASGSPGPPELAATGAEAAVPSCLSCHDDAMLNAHLQRFEVAGRTVSANLEELSALAPRSAPLVQKLETNIRQWREAYGEYVRLSNAGRFDEAHDLLTGRIFPILNQAEASASELERGAQVEMEASNRQGEDNVRFWRQIAIALVVVCLMTAAMILRIVYGSTSKLKSLVRNLISLAGHFSNAGAQVAASGAELERSAAAQAGSLNEATDEARHANLLANSSASEAHDAQVHMEEASKESLEAGKAVVSLQEAMTGMDESTRMITGTLRSINEIAFQTNLLALNASVEAARAGQAGLGFSVVAGEIRTLAARCSEAANETATLVEEIESRSKAGRDRLALASSIIQRIEKRTGTAASALSRISDSIHRQSTEIAQMDTAIRNAAGMASRNQHLAAEGSQDAQQVQTASESLSAVISALGRLVDGSGADVAALKGPE